MLNTTAALELPLVTPPVPVTGNFLAKNRLSLEGRIAVMLRLLRGNAITESTVAKAARLCRARRGRINQHLERHRKLGEALAKAFGCASTEDRIAFVRSIGCEAIWNTLTQAVN